MATYYQIIDSRLGDAVTATYEEVVEMCRANGYREPREGVRYGQEVLLDGDDVVAQAVASYRVVWTDGSPDVRCPTYDAAVEAIMERYENAEVGHDGDIMDGGHRTLAWATEDDSEGDDGARAIARIVEVA